VFANTGHAYGGGKHLQYFSPFLFAVWIIVIFGTDKMTYWRILAKYAEISPVSTGCKRHETISRLAQAGT